MLFADRNAAAVQRAGNSSKAMASNPNYHTVSVTLDVADAAAVEGMANMANKEFGRIDYLVNSAGV